MATAFPRSPRPSYGPPTASLPALPVEKTRKATGNLPASSDARPGRQAQSIKSGLRSPSTTSLPTTSNALPKYRPTTSTSKLSAPGVNSAGKTIRKTISINSFPQPPRGIRTSSLPPSPLSGGVTPTNAVSSNIDEGNSSTETSPLTPDPRRKKSAITPLQQSFTKSSPTLLDGSGATSVISFGAGTRDSTGLLSLPSPPQSRSSSAQDSYSTSATNYDDPVETGRVPPNLSEATIEDSAKVSEGKGNVIVSVRVRPDAGGSRDAQKTDGEWMVDGRRSLVAFKGREGGDYYYDNVFATHDNNAKVYDAAAKRLVRRVMEGYHGTVFAYGMTGTGKTFSMQGTATSPGVIPLAITDIFSYIRETPSREFLLRVSYLEIYNEKIHDLLSASATNSTGPQEEIKLREDPKRGVYASPLKEEIVQSPTQLLRVIARGDHARRTSSTQFNARSSRSHAVVQIVVESRERMPGVGSLPESKRCAMVPGGVRVSTLSLIDLAGSERAAETKERRTEGSHINKSLLTLGTVIARLSGDKDKEGKPTDKDGKHLPYRDSKLTRLLQGALSGDSLVSILCTIQISSVGSAAAANSHTGETLNTLKFASRAKNNIVSHAKKAEEALGVGGDGGAKVLLERYRMEIQELRSQLDGQAKAKIDEDERVREKEAEMRHEEQMLEMQLARTALKERIEHLNRLIISSQSTGVNSSGSYSALGMHPRLSIMSSSSQLNLVSSRQSVATSEAPSTRKSLDRTLSVASVSTLGQLPKGPRLSGGDNSPEEEDSAGEYGDGKASLAAQNRALQADLADKNRYISTLEKRLLQARRSSHSRTSIGFTMPAKAGGIMVGEDHGVSTLLKEKDAEIEELRARLDDKDHMLTALRSAARSRDVADRPIDRSRSSMPIDETNSAKPASAGQSPPMGKTSPRKARGRQSAVDPMSKMLDEMLEGHFVSGDRNSIGPGSRAKDTAQDLGITAQLPRSDTDED